MPPVHIDKFDREDEYLTKANLKKKKILRKINDNKIPEGFHEDFQDPRNIEIYEAMLKKKNV